MVKKQDFGHGLQQIQQVVVAAHVGQLVGQNGFQLPVRKTRGGAQRQQDYRPQPAHHQRARHQGRGQQPHPPPQPRAQSQRVEPDLPGIGQSGHAVMLEALHVGQPAQKAQRHGQHSQEPAGHQQGQMTLKINAARSQPSRQNGRRGPPAGQRRFGGNSGNGSGGTGFGGGIGKAQLICGGSSRRRRRLIIIAKREARPGQQQPQRPGRDAVAHGGRVAVQQHEQQRGAQRQHRALPERVQQGPAQGPHQGGRGHFQELIRRAHRWGKA